MATIVDITTVPWAAIKSVAGVPATSIINMYGLGGPTPPPAAPAYVLPTSASAVDTGWGGYVYVDSTYAIESSPAASGTQKSFRLIDVSGAPNHSIVSTTNTTFTELGVAPFAKVGNVLWCFRSSSGGTGSASYIFGFDITNPASPVIRGVLTIETGSSLISDTQHLVYNGHLVLINYANPSKLYIINVDNPDAPYKRGIITIPTMINAGTAINAFMEGSYYYISCREAHVFQIYNLANLDAPVLLGSVSVPGEAYDTHRIPNTNYVYDQVWGGSTYVIDTTNPAAPTLAATLPDTNSLSDGTHYVRGTKLFQVTGATIRVFNVANPLSPVLEASATVPPPSPATSFDFTMAFQQNPWATRWINNYAITFAGAATNLNGVYQMYFPINI